MTENRIWELTINTSDYQESNFNEVRGRRQIANVYKGNCWYESDSGLLFSDVGAKEKK